MNDKEIYQQEYQAKLDEWKAEIDRLKAKPFGAGADARQELNQQIEELEIKVEEGKAKLAELAEVDEDKWESFKAGAESVWNSLKSSINDVAAKFKR